MHARLLSVAAAAAAALAALPTAALASARSPVPSPGRATFEGHLIDLSTGWEAAKACVVFTAGDVAECFRTRAALVERETQLEAARATSPLTAAASCSTPLRLFADSSYGGRELDFYDRGYWQNLSTWGFDNQLSSYKVGGCGVYLADSSNGGGSWYPGNTSAGHNEPTLLSGWNDRISSIYIW